MMRKCMSMLLVLALLLAVLPAGAVSAKEPDKIRTLVQINPEYEGLILPGDIPDASLQGKVEFDSASGYLSVSEAGDKVRESLKQRDTTVSVSFYTTERDENTAVFLALYAGMEHTGEPTEGDYLLKHFGGARASYYQSHKYYDGQRVYEYDVTYTIEYLTTASQEAEMDIAVEQLLDELALDGQDDYHKFMAVYDYICANITYDYDNLYDETYLLKHSAYAALIHKTAVCQGYASLLYRLMLELGIDCRYIAGHSYGGRHGWNIVQLEGLYYNADSTWDAGNTVYDWCLLSDANFTDHSRDSEYMTNAFYETYPMGLKNYDPAGDNTGALANGVCGPNLIWMLTEDGVLTIYGSGNMCDYGDYGIGESAPWSAYAPQIKELVMADTVATIGHEAFAGCTALTTLDIPADVNRIGYRAFAGCTGLQRVTVGSDCKWNSVYREAFIDCTNLKDVFIDLESMLVNADVYWWANTCLMDYAERIYAISSVENVSEVIYRGFTCVNSVQTVTIDGVSYDMYTKGVHSYVLTVVEPTCTERGRRDDRCEYCNHGTTEYFTALGHEWDENDVCRTCGELMIYRVNCSPVLEDLLVIDGAYYTADGYPVFIALDVPVGWLFNDTMKNYVQEHGEDQFSLTYWDQLLAAMNEDGFVPLTEETKVWFMDLLSGHPYWGDDESYLSPFLGIQIRDPQAHTHAYTDVVTAPTCTEDGYTTYTCSCGDSYVADYVAALGHNEVADPEIAATCTEDGLTAGSHCAACGEVLEAQEVIPATGHHYVDGKCHCGEEEVATVLFGDVNGDGRVDTTDAKLIMQYDLGLIGDAELILEVADVNGDGRVDTTDAKLIMQLDLGLITEFPKAT